MVAVLVALSALASDDIVATVAVAMSSFVDGLKSLSGLYSAVSKRYCVTQAVFFFVRVLFICKTKTGGKKCLLAYLMSLCVSPVANSSLSQISVM